MLAVESPTRPLPHGLLSESDWTFVSADVAAGLWSVWSKKSNGDPITVSVDEDGLIVDVKGAEPWWFDEVITSLVTVTNLPDNWDGYGGLQPTLISAKQVLEILDEVLSPGLPIPAIVPTSPGGIQLEWHARGIDLEVEITPDGHVSGYLDDPWRQDEQEWDLTSDRTALSEALVRML